MKMYVLTDADAQSEAGDDLLDEMQRVRRHSSVRDGGAVVERYHVTLSQTCA